MTGNVTDRPPFMRKPPGRGLPLLAEEPRTLAGLFVQAVKKHNRPDALNFKSHGAWKAISSAEMLERAGNIALGLYSLGLRKGNKAAIIASNSPDWTLMDAGCQLAGVIDVPIYTTLAPQSVQYIINDSEAKIFFIQDKAAFERIEEILVGCPTIENLVLFKIDRVELDSAISLEKLEADGARLRDEDPSLLESLTEEIKPGDIATLIYTSGTTGEPKGVMLTHTNIISNVIDAGEKYTFRNDDVPLSVLPLSHIFERSAMYLYILNGMAVHYAESVDKAPDNLREVRPTILVGVPRIFEKVYARAKLKAAQTGGNKEKIFDWAIEIAKEYALRKDKRQSIPFLLRLKHKAADTFVYSKFRAFFGGRLDACFTGGAALPDDIYLIFTGAGISIYQGYGLTETSPVITSSNPIDVRLGKVGKPIRNMKVRIAADGEIEATGPAVMLGYYNKPDATREAFTEDGWFKTGDIGDLDEDGFLCITDRKKELFKTSGGKYIAPSPIEQMIRSSRFVNQVVLVGNERKFAAALIVPNFEQLASYAKIKQLDIKTPKDFCESPKIIDLLERQIDGLTQNLSRYEKVKRIAFLENEFTVDGGELTPTLKIKRRVVDEKYKDIIDKIYAEA
ncbi:MAG: long-chain fatty acid--CoA ligase [Saprospiraceae bacterium]|nr:long-chain fatty acid--CoA ligase [Pyrinomonadaceae bacterium]